MTSTKFNPRARLFGNRLLRTGNSVSTARIYIAAAMYMITQRNKPLNQLQPDDFAEALVALANSTLEPATHLCYERGIHKLDQFIHMRLKLNKPCKSCLRHAMNGPGTRPCQTVGCICHNACDAPAFKRPGACFSSSIGRKKCSEAKSQSNG